MSKALTAPSTEAAGIRARRMATDTLSFLGRVADPIGATVVVVLVVGNVFHIGPDAMQPRGLDLILAAAIVFGFAQAFQLLVFSGARAIDPDVRDGDSALEAAAILRDLREDVANGAELDTVLDRLRAANIGTALGDLVADLAKAYEDEDDHRFADPLWAAVTKLRDADRAVAGAVAHGEE